MAAEPRVCQLTYCKHHCRAWYADWNVCFTICWICATKQTPSCYDDLNALFFLHSRTLFPAFTKKKSSIAHRWFHTKSTKLNQFAICVCLSLRIRFMLRLCLASVWYVSEVWTLRWVFCCSLFLTDLDHVIILFVVRIVNDAVSATFVTLHTPYYIQRCLFEANSCSSSSQIHRVLCNPRF
jgi:hypothetical protein